MPPFDEIGNYQLYTGNVNSNGSLPSIWVLGGVPSDNTGHYNVRRFNFSDIMNLVYSSGNLPINRITGLQPALDAKQAALISGSNLKTINGISILGTGDIPISGGSFNPNDPQTKTAVAQISRDSAQNNIFPTSGKTFEVVDGKLFLRGERFTPTVQAGSNISSNASASLDPGSTDRAGVVQLIVSITISPSDNTQLVLVSFGGTVYANPPSVTPAIGQTAPGIKVVSVTTIGFTLASTGSFTLPPGTYRFPYHTESL